MPSDSFGMMVWLALECGMPLSFQWYGRGGMVLEREGYGMSFPAHGTME